MFTRAPRAACRGCRQTRRWTSRQSHRPVAPRPRPRDTIVSTSGRWRGRRPAALQVRDQLVLRQALFWRQRRAKHRRNHDLVRRIERAWRSRPERPDGTTRPTAARRSPRCGATGCAARSALKRFGDGGRMMREVVVDDDVAASAHDFETSLHASKRGQPLPQRVDAARRIRVRPQSRPARCGRCARRPAATSNLPSSRPL